MALAGALTVSLAPGTVPAEDLLLADTSEEGSPAEPADGGGVLDLPDYEETETGQQEEPSYAQEEAQEQAPEVPTVDFSEVENTETSYQEQETAPQTSQETQQQSPPETQEAAQTQAPTMTPVPEQTPDPEDETTAKIVLSEQDLLDAIDAAPESTEVTTISIGTDISISDTVTIPSGKFINLVAGMPEILIDRASGFNGDMFSVEGILTFEKAITEEGTYTGHITVNGSLGEDSHQMAVGSIIHVMSGGNFGMDGSLSLSDNTTAARGGAIANEGNVYLLGGEISDNSASEGGAIFNEGIIALSGTVLVHENTGFDGETENNIALSGEDAGLIVAGSLSGSSEIGVHLTGDNTSGTVVEIDPAAYGVEMADVLDVISYDNDAASIDSSGNVQGSAAVSYEEEETYNAAETYEAAETFETSDPYAAAVTENTAETVVTQAPEVTPVLTRTSGPVWITHDSAELTCSSDKDGWYYAAYTTGNTVPEFDVAEDGIAVRAGEPFTIHFGDIESEEPITIYVLIKDTENNLSIKGVVPLSNDERPAAEVSEAEEDTEDTLEETQTEEELLSGGEEDPEEEGASELLLNDEEEADAAEEDAAEEADTEDEDAAEEDTAEAAPVILHDWSDDVVATIVEPAEEGTDEENAEAAEEAGTESETPQTGNEEGSETPEECTVKGIDKPFLFRGTGDKAEFTVIGTGSDITSPKEGDVRWIPISWACDGLDKDPTFKTGEKPEEYVGTLENESEITTSMEKKLEITLKKQVYTSGSWTDQPASENKTDEFTIKLVTAESELSDSTAEGLEDLKLIKDKKYEFTITGASSAESAGKEPQKDDTRWIPVSWQCEPLKGTTPDTENTGWYKFESVTDNVGKANIFSSTTIDDEKTYKMQVAFKEQTYDGTKWEDSDPEMTGNQTFEVTTARITPTNTPTPTPTNTPTPTPTNTPTPTPTNTPTPTPTNTPTPTPTNTPTPTPSPTPAPARGPIVNTVDQCIIRGLENDLELKPNVFYPITAIGAGTSATENAGTYVARDTVTNDYVEGDTRYVPAYWQMEGSSTQNTTWKIGSPRGINEDRDINIDVYFQKQVFKDGKWTIGSPQYESKRVVVHAKKYETTTLTGTPTPSVTGYNDPSIINGNSGSSGTTAATNTGTTTSTGATTATGARTGDETPLASTMTMAALSLLAGGYIIVRKRKKA